MRSAKRIIAIVLSLIMLASVSAFASAAIVSPAKSSIVYSDSFLVSVKVSDAENIRVTVYEKKDSRQIEIVNDKGIAEKRTQYFSVDVKDFTEDDIALIAAGRLLDDNNEPILLSTGAAVKRYTDFTVGEAETFKNETGISFYTKQLSDVKPGLYRVKVELLDGDGLVKSVSSHIVAVKEKELAPQEDVLSGQQNAVTVIQNLLKSIFK